ncbi:ENV2 protein, partial [Mystacornis crossleyi]|nr:ENV2 protein [Mystacornis crossleyi]
LTSHCWLCFGIKPPYYDAIGISESPTRSNESSPGRCNWGKETGGITPAQVTGQGRCVG